MKASFRLIFAALAALALTACTREIIPGREGTDPQDGVRTIAVSFAAPTKTSWTPTETGIQPKFDKGDVIKVSNGSACEEKAIDLDPQGNPYFTTSLTGDLKAVYPASAAKLNGNAIEGVKVPAIQSGRFADANICMADIGADAKEATFHNETAILRFYVDESIDVKMITVMCQNGVISTEAIDIEEEMNQKVIIVLSGGMESLEDLSGSPEDLKPLSATTDDPGKRLCYVAILPVSNDNIGFFSMASTQDATGGLSQIINYNVSLGKGNIANAFIPYYIKVRVNGTDDAPEYQRWSYCNLGAFLPEEAGYYYSWGNSTGHWKNGVSDGYPFSSDSYALTPGFSLSKDIQPTSEFDAVFNAWVKGQEDAEELKWRMPTKGEFEKLLGGTELSGDSENNLLVFNGTPLRLPLSGLVKDGEFCATNDNVNVGMYWTATICEYSGEANGIMCWATSPFNLPVEADRYYGMPIRPIFGEPTAAEEEEEAALVSDTPEKGGLKLASDQDDVYITSENGISYYAVKCRKSVNAWDAQIQYEGLNLESGATYRLRVKARVSGEKYGMYAFLQVPKDGYPNCGDLGTMTLTPEWQEFELTAKCTLDGGEKLIFNIGDYEGEIHIASVTLEKIQDAPEQTETLVAQFGPDDIKYWQEGIVQGECTTEDGVYCLKLTTPFATYNPWDNQFSCWIGHSLENGKTYKVKVKIKTSEPFSIPCEIQYPDEDVWPSFSVSPNLATSTQWQELTCTGVCDIDYASRINFSIGDFVGDFYVAQVSIYCK